MLGFILILTFGVSLPLLHGEYDTLCSIDDRSYTGYRLLNDHEVEMNFKNYKNAITKNGVTLVECKQGKELYNVKLNASESVFNRDINIPNSKKSIRIIRRDPYKHDSNLRYIPSTVVGVIFIVDEDGECQPNSLLIADSWHKWHMNKTGTSFTNTHVFTSLLRTPDVLDKTYPRNDNWKANEVCYE
ncbi:hypothetical protein DASB73_016820 [Starmerella bacillaris]|uniref:Uncharacterized protein n=1 Tax=Starmerella bacillaris TaxID=1247836 RepID=A0AAV5RGK3_STABA|nr:hypothetical protein DASB73_016820 [Starmerella bacillaris]